MLCNQLKNAKAAKYYFTLWLLNIAMVTVAHLEMIENDDIFPRKPSSDHQSWAFTTVFPYIFLCMFTLNEMCIPGRKKNIAAKATKPAKVVESIAQGMGFQDFTKQTIFSL